jgi:hypothetical protein
MSTILGPIIRLQIQLSSLKVGAKPNRHYITDPLLSVERLRVTRDGVFGLTKEAGLMDVHHAMHPLKKNDEMKNSVSVGFTGHYAEMQGRYGPHMGVGCAGENIIIDCPRRVTLAEVERGFVLQDAAGREKGRLGRVLVATPCKPFSGFAHRGEQVPPETLKETLQFLDDGTRGFYCAFEGSEATVLHLGDLIALA